MNLKNIRQSKNLNQAELAEMIGVHQTTIQRAETGHHTAKLSTYKQCAEALGVDLIDLFDQSRTETEISLLSAFRRTPPEKQERILEILRLMLEDRA